MEKRLRTKFIQYDDVGNLLCYKCNKYKPEEDFDNSPSNWFRNGKDRRCKDGRIPTNVSVDRIDSKKGYTRDNVQLVCMAINQMKSDLDNNTFYNLCKAVYRNAAKWKH